MKKEIIAFLSGALIFGTAGVLATEYAVAPNSFPVTVNGRAVDLEGYNINDRTYFQLRDIGEKVGFDVGFDNSTIRITTSAAPTATPAPTPIPLSDIPPAATQLNPKLKGSTLDGLTSDGIPYEIIEGEKYVSITDINIVYDIEKYFFGLFPPTLTDKQYNDVITDIPHQPKHSSEIEFEYYETVLRPYLQEHCR